MNFKMKQTLISLLLFLTLGNLAKAQDLVVIEGFSNQHLSIVMNDSVYSNVMAVGEVANKVVSVEALTFVVNSGSFPNGDGARLLKIPNFELCNAALSGTQAIPDTIDLPNGSNPWDLEVDYGVWGAYTGYLSALNDNQVYKISLLTGVVLDTVDVGANPQGLLVRGDQLFVANSGFGSNNTVSIIDLTTFTVSDTVIVHDNPQDLAYFNGKIYTVCSGAFGDSSGMVIAFDEQTHAITDTFLIGNSPGSLAIMDNGIGFCGDAFAATNAGVYSFDAVNGSVIQDAQTLPTIAGGFSIKDIEQDLTVSDFNTINFYDPSNLSLVNTLNFANSIQDFDLISLLVDDISENEGSFKKEIDFQLQQNFPNPFNPTTTISYEFEVANFTKSKLTIFNILGEEVQEFVLTQPQGSVVWNGTNKNGNSVSSGVYYYSLSNGKFTQTKRMTLLK
ncbi:MAG: T9SS C-terminal target domain-containing protein [Calditrichaeota bacterium]|nr:MAG: T9SS C-terminal target domain-containing protein [Calditrichota bacterium]